MPALEFPFNCNPAATKKIQRRRAPDHAENRIIGQTDFLALSAFEHHFFSADTANATAQHQANAAGLAAAFQEVAAGSSDTLGYRA